MMSEMFLALVAKIISAKQQNASAKLPELVVEDIVVA
jgi:hypothetical protein